MQKKIDPNRRYNRDAIDNGQHKIQLLMDIEALHRGREAKGLPKLTDKKEIIKEIKRKPTNDKVYTDIYTGETLRGGDAYDFEHIVSSHYLFMKLRATHTDEEIAEIANNPKNVGMTRRDLNKYKDKYNLKERILDDNEKVEKYGIDKNRAKQALIEAENSFESLSKVTIPKSYDTSKSERMYKQSRKLNEKVGSIPPVKPNTSSGSTYSSDKSSGSNSNSSSNSSSNSTNPSKILIKLILVILVIIIFLLLFFWIKDIFPFDNKNSQSNNVPQTELVSDNNDVSEMKLLDEESTKPKLSFAKPLDDLTKSVTDISEFNSIVENQNIIPVIGSMFVYNSTAISNNGKAVLAGFANEFNKVGVPVKVLIEGFTCTIGSKEYNRILGEKRAENLRTELVSLGIAKNIIVIKPIGEDNFVSTDSGNKDLVQNRRSNVTIISTE